MAIYWLILALLMAGVEIATINLVSIWFAVGALITSVLAIYVESIYIQVAVFVVSSLIIFLAVKPFSKKFVGFSVPRMNINRVIGKVGIVTEDIEKLKPGEVKVDGKLWTAVADKKIKVGSKVEILAIDGVKLQVKVVEEEN